MSQLNAFIARSFDPRDELRIRSVLDFLDTFQKVGFFCETAEAAEVESVSEKVRRMIDEREVFIGFFTRRNPVYGSRSRMGEAWDALRQNRKVQSWTAPPWVLQESGYALRGDRKLILLKETGVELPSLQGDLEYVSFDTNNPAAVFSKLSEMINGLLAEASGTRVSIIVTHEDEQTEVATEMPASQVPTEAPNETGEEPTFEDLDLLMRYSAYMHDLNAVAKAWEEGNQLLVDKEHSRVDKVGWDSFYFECRFKAGATDALEDLKRLRDKNPDRFEPNSSIARCYFESNEFDLAGPLYLEVAASEDAGKPRSLLMAAKAFHKLTRYTDALEAIKAALPIIPDELRDEAHALHFQLLKEQGDDYLAFATAEAALHENPLLPVRFNLGLEYRRMGLNEIALYHFKFLYDRNSNNSAALHNFALLSAECKMPIAAAERYKTAFGLGETLSAANLGYMYLNAGMAEDARARIHEAMKSENYDPAVEKCLAEIRQRRLREEKTETEALTQATEQKNFFTNMGRALSASSPQIDGRWMFPFGEIPLSVISGKVEGTADVKRQQNTMAIVLGGLGGQPTERVDTYVISGKLTGAVCVFTMTSREKGVGGGLGPLLGSPTIKTGFMIFASDGKSATYVQLSDSKFGKAAIIKKT